MMHDTKEIAPAVSTQGDVWSSAILRLSIIVCIMLHSWSIDEELKWRLSIDL